MRQVADDAQNPKRVISLLFISLSIFDVFSFMANIGTRPRGSLCYYNFGFMPKLDPRGQPPESTTLSQLKEEFFENFLLQFQ